MAFTHRNELLDIFGPAHFRDTKEELFCHAYDATRTLFMPDAVVAATCVEQISQLMAFANRCKIPVTPRGAGTGYTGGSLAASGGIILCMDRLNRILELDTGNMIAVVEPGVVTADLHNAVEQRGLFYPPDPGSMHTCTIGGNIAENAGGMRAVKYGVTRDYVMGLEVVLPSGQIIRTGSKCIKDVVGYDLTNTFVGSEGTLGIITRAILKLVPLPEQHRTMTAAFPHLHQAARTVVAITKSRIVPTALEFMDRHCIRAVDHYLDAGLSKTAEAFLLMEVDGFSAELSQVTDKMIEVCRANGAQEIRVAETEEERQDLWDIRRAISAALSRFPIRGEGEDLVVPRTRIPEIIRKMEAVCLRHGLFPITFGHAGDGNLHVSLAEKNGAVDATAVDAASREIMKETVKIEGRIAAEHGIGIIKKDKIGLNIDPATLEAMRALKTTFDPNNILNPGKIFPDNRHGRTGIGASGFAHNKA